MSLRSLRQERPILQDSGTEPKIKFYMGVKGTSLEDAQKKVEDLTNEVKAVIEK